MASRLLLQHNIAIHYAVIRVVDQSMSIWPNTQSSTGLLLLVRHIVMFHRRLADTPTRKPTRKHPGLDICVEGYSRTVHYKHDLSPPQACWPWHQLDVHKHTDSQHTGHFQICVFIVVYHGSWMWSTAFTQIIVLRVGVPRCMNKLHRSATLPRTNPNHTYPGSLRLCSHVVPGSVVRVFHIIKLSSEIFTCIHTVNIWAE